MLHLLIPCYGSKGGGTALQKITVQSGIERVVVVSGTDLIDGNIEHAAVGVVDRCIRDRVPDDAGARNFVDAAALIRKGRDVKDGVTVNQAVAE